MKRIKIQNFRCYTKPFVIEFKNNINLFIGDNGSLLSEEPIQISFEFNRNTFSTIIMFGGRKYNPGKEHELFMIQKWYSRLVSK